jgi:DNA-binding LytR/AlgR family response regulator
MAMKIVIIEDEHLTAERIRTLLQQIDPDMEVLAILDSVISSVRWFEQNRRPDLVFMDIQLADGISFDIFENVTVECPVIFITAYQEYAIKAFKVNSVDYLLKPVTGEALATALEKYRHYFVRDMAMPPINRELLDSIRQMISKPYKTRFMVRVGDRIKSLDVDRILYFYSFQKGTYLHTSDNRSYVIDYTLDGLAELLDPEIYFRINRQYIISYKSITGMITLSGSKLKVNLAHAEDADIFISRDRLTDFKEWLDR